MKKTLTVALFAAVLSSCKKEEKATPAPATPSPAPTTANTFEGLTFTRKTAFFSTDGSMTAPVDSAAAQKVAGKIDITFTWNYDYGEAGFFDPIARSKVWYWTYDYSPWCSAGVETKFYYTKLNQSDFNAAKTDRAKIASFMADASVEEAPHTIYPVGSCIGGRETSGEKYLLRKGKVFAFKNVVSGKKGLIYVRTDQDGLWPDWEEETKVDIIREN